MMIEGLQARAFGINSRLSPDLLRKSTSLAPTLVAPTVSPAAIDTYTSISGRSKGPTPTVRPRVESFEIERRLFNSLAAMKMKTADVAMHLSAEWRDRLFSYLDMLLDAEDWNARDKPANIGSFTTFLRMVLHLRVHRQPGMGLTSEGNIVATWTEGDRHLTVECFAADYVVWSIAVPGDGEVESAAGKCKLQRIREVLVPYQEEIWFAASKQSSERSDTCPLGSKTEPST